MTDPRGVVAKRAEELRPGVPYVRGWASAKKGAEALAEQLAAIGLESDFLSVEGLPDRPWFRHLIYAPGTLTGYGAKTLPGVREAVEAGHYEIAAAYIAKTAKALDRYATFLDAARAFAAAGTARGGPR